MPSFESIPPEFWPALAIGFLAQLVDGALGMAYGLISTSFLLTLGVPPAQASAMVHTAETFTTAMSGASHALQRNVNWSLVGRLALAGIVGGVLGATFLVAAGEAIRPLIALYLFIMGLRLILSALRARKPEPPRIKGAIPLGLVGGFLDASGGGGWGPIVTTTLLGAGHAPRTTIGSVNISEFLVTAAIAAAFAVQIQIGDPAWIASIVGLLLGGLLAAPLAAYVVRFAPARPLTIVVGFVVVCLALWQFRGLVLPLFGG